MAHNPESGIIEVPLVSSEASIVQQRTSLVPLRMIALEEFPVGQNTLGLEGVKDPDKVRAERLFNALAYITEKVLDSNPAARQELLNEGDSLELPELRVDEGIRYGIRYTETSYEGIGATSRNFCLYRTDSGNSGMGFMIRQIDDDHTIVPLDINAIDDISEPEDMLAEAMNAVLHYGDIININPRVLRRQSEDQHLTYDTLARFTRQASYETTRRFRLQSVAKAAGRYALAQAARLITREGPNGLGRKMSPYRLVGLALLLPIPGYSSGLFDTSILRPASVELVADAVSLGADLIGSLHQPTAEEVYDAKELDTVGIGVLRSGAEASPIQYANAQDVPEGAVTFGYDTDPDIALLGGTSPRRFNLATSLGPLQCSMVLVDTDSSHSNVSLFTTNPSITGSITVERSGDAVYICNTDKSAISPSEASLVFDSNS